MRFARLIAKRTVLRGRHWLVYAVVVLVACFGLPALAGKPGSKGQRSAASVTISLEIRPTVSARHMRLSVSNDTDAQVTGDYLCLTLSDPGFPYRIGFARESSDIPHGGFMPTPVDHVRRGYRNDPLCTTRILLDSSALEASDDGPVVLIVSPE